MTGSIWNQIILLSAMCVIVFSTGVDDQVDCQALLRRCPKGTIDTGTICGNDGRNYRHMCHLLRRSCKMNLPQLEKFSDGKCVDDRKDCPRKCESGTRTSKVCGSDGRTYATECAVRRRKCRVDLDLTVAYQGRCRPKEEVDPQTSKQTVEVVDETIEREATDSPFEEVEIVIEIIEIGTTELPKEE